MIPIAVTFLVLHWLFVTMDGITAPLLARLAGNLFPGHRYIPGIGIVTTFGIIYLMGLVATNVMGKRLVAKGEETLSRIPLVKNIYLATKQLITAFSMPGKDSFREVVFLEFPRPGTYAIGFVTNEMVDQQEKEFFVVFVPTTPNPTSGFVLVIPKGEVIHTDLTIEEGFKHLISGGIIFSTKLQIDQTDLENQARKAEAWETSET